MPHSLEKAKTKKKTTTHKQAKAACASRPKDEVCYYEAIEHGSDFPQQLLSSTIIVLFSASQRQCCNLPPSPPYIHTLAVICHHHHLSLTRPYESRRIVEDLFASIVAEPTRERQTEMSFSLSSQDLGSGFYRGGKKKTSRKKKRQEIRWAGGPRWRRMCVTLERRHFLVE